MTKLPTKPKSAIKVELMLNFCSKNSAIIHELIQLKFNKNSMFRGSENSIAGKCTRKFDIVNCFFSIFFQS